jgi:hypothetical protein
MMTSALIHSVSFADTMPGEIANNINSARFSISFLPSFVRDTFDYRSGWAWKIWRTPRFVWRRQPRLLSPWNGLELFVACTLLHLVEYEAHQSLG